MGVGGTWGFIQEVLLARMYFSGIDVVMPSLLDISV